MREAKYRAWDKIAKPNRMKTWEQLLAQYQLTLVFTSKDFELMQYTGLHDKNGTEIYEGDICNCEEYECFGKVEWNDDEAGFFFCVVIEGGGFEEERLYEYVDELEIIGNIYENPELLESEE